MTQDEEWLLKEKYHGEKTEGFIVDCNRLKDGEPLAYIIGNIPFINTTIFLDSHPLIPRTETEFWVKNAIDDIHTQHRTSGKILDLCAGSGCIGVAILKNIEWARVDFVEIDTPHHPTIRKNIIENGISPFRTRIFTGDLFESITEKYEYIFTNPPYIDKNLERVAEDVLLYEPSRALFGGKDGMDFIKIIIENSSNFLTSTGSLYTEHEPEQTEEIRVLATNAGFFAQTFLDQFGRARYTHLTRTERTHM